MEWTADVSDGDWIRERLDPDDPRWGATMHSVVPRGFAAYARVFHPASRDRPVGEPWPPRPYDRHAPAWAQFQAREPQIETQRVSWSATAAAFDRRMHPLARWHRLAVDPDQSPGEDGPRDADGWRYTPPPAGTLEADVLARVAAIAAAHTTTPDDARAALWDGHAGIVGTMGFAPSRALLTSAPAADAHHGAFLASSARDTFNTVFRKPSWQPGILSDEISRGPRLELPHRAYLLFHTGLKELTDAGWAERVPWAEDDPQWTVSPGLLWPVDRAWAVVTEVDADSTIIAGSPELIRDVCGDTAIEALPIPEGAAVTSDADGIAE